MNKRQSKYDKGRFNQPVSRKNRKEESQKKQQCRKNIEEWINKLPDPKDKMADPQGQEENSIIIEHEDFLEIVTSTPKKANREVQEENIVPSRLRSGSGRNGDEIIDLNCAILTDNENFKDKQIKDQRSKQQSKSTSNKSISEATKKKLVKYQYKEVTDCDEQLGKSNQESNQSIIQGNHTTPPPQSQTQTQAHAPLPPASPIKELNTKTTSQTQSDPTDNMSIVELIQKLNTRLDSMDTKLDKLDAYDRKINDMQNKLQDAERRYDEKVIELERKNEVARRKVRQINDKTEEVGIDQSKLEVMIDVIINQDNKIREMNKVITQLQARSMRQNIVISGLSEIKDEDCKQKAKEFFKENLKIKEEIDIEIAHRMGEGRNRPMVIKLRNQEDKAIIFKNSPSLKDQKNKDDKPYYVNDQLPDAITEHKRQIRLHLNDGKNRSDGQKPDMYIKQGVLYVDGYRYVKPFQPPTAIDMIQAPYTYRKEADKMKLHEGETIQERGSTFIGYAVEVDNIEEVKKAYFKMKKMHGQAEHIACSFRLPGCIGPKGQDMLDDGEYGSARVMLQYMKNQQMVNIALFMVRYYGGVKLGPQRFAMMIQSVKSAYEILVNTSFEQAENQPQIEQQDQS